MAMSIADLRSKIEKGEYRISEHAIKRMITRTIAQYEIVQAIAGGEIIEEYREDKYSPSCLIYGTTNTGRDLHVQVSLPPKVVVITTYPPDPEEWIDCRIKESKMKCVFCGGKVEARQTTFVYDEDGDYFFVENVPAEVCAQCGEKTFSPEVTVELIRLAQKKLIPARKVEVPVFDYAIQAS